MSPVPRIPQRMGLFIADISKILNREKAAKNVNLLNLGTNMLCQ